MKISMNIRLKDEWLQKRLENYNEWLDKDKIDFPSKVVPIRESLDTDQWVIPTDQALSVLEKARFIALTDCICRAHNQRCDNPLDVCLLLGDFAEKFVKKELALPVSLEQAKKKLKIANEKGLVHLTLYRPDHQIYALCSCCTCCCHDLQMLVAYGITGVTVHGDYVAQTDEQRCDGCGLCQDRCPFGARIMDCGNLLFSPDRCYGCGLCVTTCPSDAVFLVEKMGKRSQGAASDALPDN